MKDKVMRVFNLPEDKLQVVHNGIPFDSPGEEFNKGSQDLIPNTGDRPTVLTIARMVEEKGLDDLLRAAVQVPGAQFLLAGDGPLRGTLEGLAMALGVADRVFFLGYREDTDDLLSDCDLFVLPSYNEGLPLAILEAMAAGRAVVASEAGGIGESVVHGETGWLVPPGNPGRLAESIRCLLEDSQLAQRFGEAGRARVLESFSVNAMVEHFTSTYQSLLGIEGSVGGR
jgi:glycosyltransferase involved in cell wall biosynthesis